MVRYLKWNPRLGILLKEGQPLTLKAWCDADCGDGPITRRSSFIQLGGSPVLGKHSNKTQSLARRLRHTTRKRFRLKNIHFKKWAHFLSFELFIYF